MPELSRTDAPLLQSPELTQGICAPIVERKRNSTLPKGHRLSSRDYRKRIFDLLILGVILAFKANTVASEESVSELRTRAERGEAVAQLQLGVLYDQGRG